MSDTKEIIVVGGGAAGMMAAIAAAKEGAKVHLYEKNEKLGKKLFITEAFVFVCPLSLILQITNLLLNSFLHSCLFVSLNLIQQI